MLNDIFGILDSSEELGLQATKDLVRKVIEEETSDRKRSEHLAQQKGWNEGKQFGLKLNQLIQVFGQYLGTVLFVIFVLVYLGPCALSTVKEGNKRANLAGNREICTKGKYHLNECFNAWDQSDNREKSILEGLYKATTGEDLIPFKIREK